MFNDIQKIKLFIVVLALMTTMFAALDAPAQSSQPDAGNGTSHFVPLVSDTCPVVHPGDTLVLDWNPGYQQAWAVTAISSAQLVFSPLEESGTIRPRPAFDVRGNSAPVDGAPSVNGYFRLQIPLGGRLPVGTFHLRSTQFITQVAPDYSGPSPEMTVSPTRDRFCIKVVEAEHSSN